jgi:hypothetical protein
MGIRNTQKAFCAAAAFNCFCGLFFARAALEAAKLRGTVIQNNIQTINFYVFFSEQKLKSYL